MFARSGPRSVVFGKAVAVCALIGFVAGMTGVPMPRVRLTGKDRSRPFPCMERSCGCASAEQCWKACCCFSNREKLAWAAEQGVTPPEYVLAAADREPPIVQCGAAERSVNCCEGQATCCEPQAEEGGEVASPVTIDFVLAIQARKCQGQAELVFTMGTVDLPPAKTTVIRQATNSDEAVVLVSTLVSVSSSPETPPPRA